LLGLTVVLAVLSLAAGACASAIVVYLDEAGDLKGVIHPDASDPASAIAALAKPVVDADTGKKLRSAVLPGTKLLDLRVEGDTTIVDFSRQIVGKGLGEDRLATIFRQVSFTLGQFGLANNVRLLAEGKLLSDYLPPVAFVAPGPNALSPGVGPPGGTGQGALSGHSITVSPGHGRYWNGSGWYFARPVYCSPLSQEDIHNLENSQYLETYLAQDGMTVKMVRSTDKSYGNHYTGYPWWNMAAYLWLQNLGYPCSVYANSTGDCTTGSGGSEYSDDIRARPLSSDYDNTDIYISLHTNGFQGDCYGSCPTGSDFYYDCSAEHAAWCTVSQNLANSVNDAMLDAIRNKMLVAWANRGLHNSNGAYGEIRIPDRAAILIELGFHDTCEYDAVLLRDNFFRSSAMWGIYKGVCDYFGATPTWDYYSCEYVSDDIPTVMEAGHLYTVNITLRNRGVLWTEAYQIRLGAVGDYDPLTDQTRQYISGEVGPNETYTFTFTLVAPNFGGTYVTDWQMLREGITWFGPIVSKTVEVSGPPDLEPPSIPANVAAEALSTSEIALTWSASTDNVGVTGYRVFRNGSPIDTTLPTSYLDTGLTANTMYTYTVTAYDGVGNESAESSPAPAVTHVVVFQEGFPDLSAWYADVVADGSTRGLILYAYSHDLYPGANCVQATPGSTDLEGCFSYRPLNQPFTTGAFNAWFFDQAAAPCRQGVHVRGFDGGGALACAAFLGTYPDPPGSGAKYSGAVFDGSAWSWAAQLQSRAIGFQDLRILVGMDEISFYINGVKKGSLPRPANVDTFGMSRVNLGYDYNVKWDGWYDDAQFTAPPPVPPTMGTPVAIGTSVIRWNFTDNSNNEWSFSLHDASHIVKDTAPRDSSYMEEDALSPNTQYTRHVHGLNGTVAGPASSSASCYTLSAPPTPSTVTCDRATSTWYATPDFNFTAVGGFGSGTVEYYRYAWEQSASHAWSGSEPQWSAGILALSAASSGSWYLHVKGYNGDGAENGTLTLGPYQYAGATGTIAEAKALADGSSVGLLDKVVTGNFGTFFYIEESDGSSGIRVEAGGPSVGTLATVAGVIQTVDGERRITDASVEAGPPGTVPAAPLLKNLDVGGGSLNAYTPGVTGGTGTNNIGLLIEIAGRVTHSEVGFCYVDDGSAIQDGSGYTGVRVDTSALTSSPAENSYVIVTGISSTYIVGVDVVRLLRPRNDADVTSY